MGAEYNQTKEELEEKMKNELVEKDKKHSDLQAEFNQTKEELEEKMNTELTEKGNTQWELGQSKEHLESLNLQLEKMKNELLEKDQKYNDMQAEYNQTKEELEEKMNNELAEKENTQMALDQTKENLESLNLEFEKMK